MSSKALTMHSRESHWIGAQESEETPLLRSGVQFPSPSQNYISCLPVVKESKGYTFILVFALSSGKIPIYLMVHSR
jgi:hypothetical protein